MDETLASVVAERKKERTMWGFCFDGKVDAEAKVRKAPTHKNFFKLYLDLAVAHVNIPGFQSLAST